MTLHKSEIEDYAAEVVSQMSDDDKDSFIVDPNEWRGGLVLSPCAHVGAADNAVYLDERDDGWELFVAHALSLLGAS